MLPQLPVDKANHVIYGVLVYLATAFFAVQLGVGAQAHMAGLIASVLAAVAKEGVDYLLNRRAEAQGQAPAHSVDPLDAAATAAGGAACWLAVALAA